MDLFGRKARAELEVTYAMLDEYREENKSLLRENDEFIKTIRDQDQLIYLMSQCTDWASMRPHFNKLQEGQERRMQAESARIRDVLIPEVRKAYTETTSKPKQIEQKTHSFDTRDDYPR